MPNEKPTASTNNTDEGLDYSSRPFGYVNPDSKTAIICEQDPVSRDKVSKAIKKIGLEVVQPATFKDALKYMRFHVFDVILVNENFNTGIGEVNNILKYLENLNMSVRRQIFVVLISAIYATMDSLQAYNKSVNMIINKSEISDIENILKQALSEHNDFYYLLKDNIRKYGNV
jgi:response regulator RpfG family c-di-GMP phosphodiesterase